ncbi:MAG: DUF4783 domain-containing protein [Flavobacteriales bacterium]|nr:DUF4783 domain-containing protein [Flavobacteriales bacterium]
MKKIFSIMLIMFVSGGVIFAQNADSNISKAIELGNHKELSKHFDTKVDLTILTKENSYSKAQAELIIKDFFAKGKVTAYQVIHRGKSRDGASYAIGTLTTATRTFRTYVLTKSVNGKVRIQQLRFEAQD